MRRDKRIEVDEAARLRPNDWSSVEVRVLDLSASGFRAECEARVVVGSAVAIEIEGIGPVRAYVAWRRGTRFGAKFDEPVDISRCAWSPLCEQVVLSRMLVERALARRTGEYGAELELQRKILDGLPIRPIRGAEPTRRKAAGSR